MSRLIVKNLPNKVTQEQITTYFSKVGPVTDVKLIYKKNKEFRGVVFVGFKSEKDADEALKQLHNTFFKKNKITVEKCEDFDPNAQKAKSENESKTPENNLTPLDKKYYKSTLKRSDEMTKEKLGELMNNPAFIQYLKLNTKGTADLVDTLRKKFDKLEQSEEKEKNEEDNEEESEEEKSANRNISDLEYLQSLKSLSIDEVKEDKVKLQKFEKLHTVVVRTKQQNTNDEKKGQTFTKKLVRDFFRPLKFHSLRIPRHLSYVAYVGFKLEKTLKQALQMDKSFIDGVQVRIHVYEKNSSGGKFFKDQQPSWKAAEEQLIKEADPIGESGKLYVRNLCYEVTEEELRELFEKIGPLADLSLPKSQLTQKPKGFAHVSFVFPEHAVNALNQLDGKSFQGRVLHILPSKIKEEEINAEGKNFKKQKEQNLKKSALSWHNWNSLFLSSGAVIELGAKSLNKSKYEMFDETDKEGSVATRLALSEAGIVQSTKAFLEEEGVSLDAFSDPSVQRSATVILVKNLSAGTVASELSEIFGKFGQLGRVILPPSGISAIIEFLNSDEAKRAFRKLAYTLFNQLPLFLEWAPIKVFNASPPKKNENKEDVTEKPARIPEENTTLYVKNLNFKTSEETLRQHFCEVGEISSVTISRHRCLSQGYGFVQFFKTSDATKALRTLQNSTLDDHPLIIKRSEKKLTEPLKAMRQFHSPGKQISAKLLVKNLAFQATWEEVKQLFKGFGEIKSLRLPKKFDSSEHKGFGFVEFTTAENAEKAMKALGSSTHLYGRRIVLEWANEEETVEELRKRTAERFLSNGPSHKKPKIDTTSLDKQDGADLEDS